MKPAELALKMDAFNREVEALSGNYLLDRQIELDSVPVRDREPDLYLHKTLAMEARLNQAFGFGNWQSALEARKAERNA